LAPSLGIGAQVIEELFTYWNFEDADQTLEELEDALIVSLEVKLLLCWC
jgi:hypothetical protein